MSNQQTQGRALKPIDEVRANLTAMGGEFVAALPPHIPVEKFQRVAITAVNSSPDLINADRRTLYGACMKAAQDGLLPDGREAALVVYNTKVKDAATGKESWVKQVQYMPMVAGILKKMRQSGEISTIAAHVVYEADEFDYYVDDDGEHFRHRPNFFAADRGRPRLVYAVAKLKDGGTQFEPMPVADVEKVRAVSKAKDGPGWSTWWDEFAKKSALKRISKRLPSSSDLEQVFKNDNEHYDLDADAEQEPASGGGESAPATVKTTRPRRPRGLQAALNNSDPQPQGEGAGGTIEGESRVIDNPPQQGQQQGDDSPI